jgi:hypothetical protein
VRELSKSLTALALGVVLGLSIPAIAGGQGGTQVSSLRGGQAVYTHEEGRWHPLPTHVKIRCDGWAEDSGSILRVTRGGYESERVSYRCVGTRPEFEKLSKRI